MSSREAVPGPPGRPLGVANRSNDPWASRFEVPTGDGVATTVRQVPRRGRPVATANQGSASLDPGGPPEKLTRPAVLTAGTRPAPIRRSALPVTSDVPCIRTGPVESWSLRPVHERVCRVPAATSRAGTVTAAGTQV